VGDQSADDAAGAVSEAVLAASGVSHHYGARHAVADVSLSLTAGEMVALIGPNGAGKTTLLSVLAGVLPADAGSVTATGKVGWVPQQAALYPRLSVRQNLAFFARLERVQDVDAAVAQMLEQTGLEARAEEQVGRLSGGNRQRVNVAIGLLGSPSVLLLDEPSASLDPGQRERLWTFLGAFTGGGTAVLFSTHDMGEAGREPDRVLEMVDGKLSGAPADGGD